MKTLLAQENLQTSFKQILVARLQCNSASRHVANATMQLMTTHALQTHAKMAGKLETLSALASDR